MNNIYTENELKKEVIKLLQIYGTLDTNQVVHLLPSILDKSRIDNRKSETRNNETRQQQKIRNIVSHQKPQKAIYYDYYTIDKTHTPAIWSIIDNLDIQDDYTKKDIKNLNIENELEKLKKKSKHIDWDKNNTNKHILGISGEEFVYQQELKRWNNDTKAVIHFSKEFGDGAGFDIQSIDCNRNIKYIEVKTTTEDSKQPFYMTDAELKFLIKNKDHAYIYRVYNFNTENKTGEILEISGKDFIENYNHIPTQYRINKIN